jgi:membrane-associated protein
MAPDPTALMNLAVNPLSANSLLAAFGAFGILFILFAETGLLVGFFLPGDSLLFTAGLLCTVSKNGVHLNLGEVLVCAVAGALIGAQVGYLIGQKGGRPLLARSRNKHVRILGKYGHAKAIVIGRFIPVVRTVLNPMAGALNVPVRTFTLWQIVGGVLWTVGVTLAGYGLGNTIPNIDTYLLPIIALIVVVSVIPIALEILRNRRAGATPAPEGPVESGK